MAKDSNLISPAVIAEMQAELDSLSNTEPGAKAIREVIQELMPLIQGCRDRGHSWSKIAESLRKHHDGISLGQLKKFAFEFEPSLKSIPKVSPKGKAKKSKKSVVPDLEVSQDDDSDETEMSNWPPTDSIDDD